MNSTFTNSTAYITSKWDFSVLSILIISFHVFNWSFSLPLNLYIISFLFPTCGVMDACNVFSLNQTIAEIFFALFGVFHSLCSLNMCIFEATGFFMGVTMSTRCLFQCCMCLERYFAVVLPVTFLRFKPLRYRVMCSITVWTYSMAVGIACACLYPRLPYSAFSAIFVLVLSVDIFCALSILKRLKYPGSGDVESNTGVMKAAKKKAFFIVFVNFLMFSIQNFPACVAFGIESTESEHSFNVAIVSSLAINSLTGILQPIAVLHRTGKLPCIRGVRFQTSSSTF